jgi:hypothetical protein
MEDVLDIYKRSYDENIPVVCIDELSKQLVEEVREVIPAKPGSYERYDTEYKRNGTANIFMAFEPLKGKRELRISDSRTKVDWAYFMKQLVDDVYADNEKILAVMDNLNTHNFSSLYEAFSPEEAKRIMDRIEIHYTPKHGSWLNMAELELSHLSRQCLSRRIPDKGFLIKEVNAWKEKRNNNAVTVDWQFTCEDARIKLKKLYPDYLLK